VVLAANADVHPAEDCLSRFLVSLGPDVREQLASRLQSSQQAQSMPARSESLAAWVAVLQATAREASEVEDDDADWRPVAVAALQAPCSLEAAPAAPQSSIAVAKPDQFAASARQGLESILADAPPEFRCSYDGKLLVDPVRTPNGHIFERSTLSRLLAIQGLCPITNTQLDIRQCQRDVELRQRIVQWVRQSRPRARAFTRYA